MPRSNPIASESPLVMIHMHRMNPACVSCRTTRAALSVYPVLHAQGSASFPIASGTARHHALSTPQRLCG